MNGIVRGLLEGLAILATLEVAMAALSVVAVWRIERLAPPQGAFLEVEGARLHVLDRGQGPPVVLIHGLGGQIGHFAHSLVGRLADDFRVVAFDRPGSGYSSPVPAGSREQAAILAGAIRVLKLGKPLIVGHSLGGAVALALALDEPDCVGALALIAPATHPIEKAPALFRSLAIRSPLMRRLFAWTLAGPAALVARNSVLPRGCSRPEPAPADFGAAGGGLLALRPEQHLRHLDRTRRRSRRRPRHRSDAAALRLADLPVGILYGRQDHILDWRAQGEAMKRDLPVARPRTRRRRPHAAGHPAGRLRPLHPADRGAHAGG